MPDVLALPNLTPRDSVRLIARAREMGFSGPITTESAQDAQLLINAIGSRADGLVMVGGASPIQAANFAMATSLASRFTSRSNARSNAIPTRKLMPMAGGLASTQVMANWSVTRRPCRKHSHVEPTTQAV